MLIAVLLAVMGIASVIILSQLFGYRLGGVIVVPILAVYTCKNFLMLPLFLVGTIVAYLGMRYLQKNTMIYGRDELIATLLLGSVLPVAGLYFMKGIGYDLTDVVFFGSVLPGLAAYNYSRIKPEYRLHDMLASCSIFIGLLVAAWILVNPFLSEAIGGLTPPVLFSPTSDLAVLKNATVDTYPAPAIIDRFSAFVLFIISLTLSEFVRKNAGIFCFFHWYLSDTKKNIALWKESYWSWSFNFPAADNSICAYSPDVAWSVDILPWIDRRFECIQPPYHTSCRKEIVHTSTNIPTGTAYSPCKNSWQRTTAGYIP